jgi:hypothetical protein
MHSRSNCLAVDLRFSCMEHCGVRNRAEAFRMGARVQPFALHYAALKPDGLQRANQRPPREGRLSGDWRQALRAHFRRREH